MQGERLPVPDSPHKMLIYSSGNCRLLICPTRKNTYLPPQHHVLQQLSLLRLILPLYLSVFPSPCLSLVLYLSCSQDAQLVEITYGIWDANSYCLLLFFLITKMLKIYLPRFRLSQLQTTIFPKMFFDRNRFVTHQYFRNIFVSARGEKKGVRLWYSFEVHGENKCIMLK